MKNAIKIANTQLLVKEEDEVIKNFKNTASKKVINQRYLVTFEQIKYEATIEASNRKLKVDVIKAIASGAGIYNILQTAGFGMRTRIGFVPSQSAIVSQLFVIGHYEHSDSAVFKVNPKAAPMLISVIMSYAETHPEVALSSKQANTRLLRG